MIAPVPHLLQVLAGGYVNAALALYRFQHHGAGVLAGGGNHRLDVVEGHVDETLRKGREGSLVVGLARCRDHGEGAPVERLHRRDDLVGAVEVDLAVLAGDLYRRLVGLCPAVLEEHLVAAGVLDQYLGQLHLGNGVVQVGNVPQRPTLLLQRLYQGRMAVPQTRDRDPAHEVKVLLAVFVPDLHALAPDEGHGLPAARGHEILAFQFLPIRHLLFLSQWRAGFSAEKSAEPGPRPPTLHRVQEGVGPAPVGYNRSYGGLGRF